MSGAVVADEQSSERTHATVHTYGSSREAGGTLMTYPN